MKPITLNLLISSFLFFSILLACTKSDTPQNELEGNWNLIMVTGSIAGIQKQYPEGDIIWTFTNDKIIVKNNYSGDLNFSMVSGTYPFTVDASKNNEISMNGQYFGNYTIKNNILTISQNDISDGIEFTLHR